MISDIGSISEKNEVERQRQDYKSEKICREFQANMINMT